VFRSVFSYFSLDYGTAAGLYNPVPFIPVPKQNCGRKPIRNQLT